MDAKTRRVGILVYDGVTALDVVGPADAFSSARRPVKGASDHTAPAYEVVTIGLTGAKGVAESGLVLEASHALDRVPALDTLIVPGGRGLREPAVTARASQWIRRRARRTRRIVSVCTGIYALAAAGLLDGRHVTTHWRFADDVAARFPSLHVHPDELFVKDGPFYTSAGVTAGIDLSLWLIEQDLGGAAALGVARELVVYVRRDGGQAQFSEPLRFQCDTPQRFTDLVAHVVAHLDDDLSVEALAARMAVSTRQLTRQCQEALGCSPGALVSRMRLDEAKSRLLRPHTTVEQVAASIGFGSADVFRRAFERRFGVTPSAYQTRFKSRRTGRAGRADFPPSMERGI